MKFKVGDKCTVIVKVEGADCGKMHYLVRTGAGLRTWIKKEDLALVERPRKYVEFKDWEEGKRYQFSDCNNVYCKIKGLPHYMDGDNYYVSSFSIETFLVNKFYEAE